MLQLLRVSALHQEIIEIEKQMKGGADDGHTIHSFGCSESGMHGTDVKQG